MSCNFHSHSSTPLFLLLFLNLCAALVAGDDTSTATSISDDANYLLQFKSSLPNLDILSDWTASSLNPCLFTGVTCTSSLSGSTRVTALDLTAIPISTTFPTIATSLLSLSSLQSLTLSSTNISGSLFPPPLQTCPPSLTHLDLSRNSLTASLPQLSSFFSSCSSLSTLNLSSNSILSAPTNWRFSHFPTLQTLDLSENHLTGRSILQRIIAGAVNLTHLSLRQNQLDGELSLENCGELVYLDVSFNKFTSTPAPGDCSALQHLDLSSNNFDGIIHDRFTGCHNLRYLNISNNAFSGPIPDLPTSVNLQFLYLSSNNFQDNLQNTRLSDACPSLLELDLSSNNLTGTIPTSFQLCSSLQILDISRNNLTGELPTDIFLKMTALKKLSVAFNDFTGELPDSISSLTGHLEILDLSANRISGRIPSSICATSTTTTTSLKELYLSDNLLTGSVPTNIGNCSQLVSLDLSFNHLTGTLPSTLGSLSNLKDLIMWMNNLEGSIPSELTYIQTLETLILDYNILTGTIPFGLRNCTNLNWISLSSNQLTGVIPSSIGELVNLSILKLSNNSLYGPIPPELGDCRSLLWIDLNSNQINGTIPPTLGNQSGKLAVGLVVGKKYVYLRNDGSKECHGAGDLFEFSGIRDTTMNKIPSRRTCNFTRIYRGNTLPTFQHNGTVMFLDLSYNLLEGEIPKELGSMYDLQILNLAHNGLSGPIPVEMGGMKSVGVMDLSYNRLSGEIPKSLGSLTLLTEINLSNNKLSGQIPATSQFDSFPADRFYNNSGLCGYPLIECKDLKGSSNGGGDEDRQRKWRQGMVAGFVGLGLLLSLLCVSVFMIVFVKVKRRGQEEGTGLDGGGGGGGKGNSNSGSTNTGWKLTGAREAMSINLATFDKPLRKLTFADLVEATNGFHHDCLVGSGGFGDVYMARLKDGITVAIKKLIHVSGQGEKEFMAEMETIGRIKHRNLVPMLGYCKVGEERLLVYEYMKYGSLDEVLRNPKKVGVTPLNWEKRRKIAIGAARGLAFLHHNCTPHVIHRDMKSSNVLLDENLEAKVSDFGMARLVGVMDTHLSVSSLAGTPGYVPPEYYQSFQCSTKGDVYSYGVVLLELLTGKKPTNSVDFGDDNLVGWVKRHAKMKISDVFDPVLMKEDYPGGLEVELLEYLKVACACLNDRPWKRPTMIQVMAMFKEIRTGSGVDSRGADGIERSFRNVDGRRGGGVDMSMEEIPEGSNL